MPRGKKKPSKVEMVKDAVAHSGKDKSDNKGMTNWINEKYGANSINVGIVASYKSKMKLSKNGKPKKAANGRRGRRAKAKAEITSNGKNTYTVSQFQAAQRLIDELGHDKAVGLLKEILPF
jgi:hypothetical protein